MDASPRLVAGWAAPAGRPAGPSPKQEFVPRLRRRRRGSGPAVREFVAGDDPAGPVPVEPELRLGRKRRLVAGRARIAVRTKGSIVEISAQDGSLLARHLQNRGNSGWLIWLREIDEDNMKVEP